MLNGFNASYGPYPLFGSTGKITADNNANRMIARVSSRSRRAIISCSCAFKCSRIAVAAPAATATGSGASTNAAPTPIITSAAISVVNPLDRSSSARRKFDAISSAANARYAPTNASAPSSDASIPETAPRSVISANVRTPAVFDAAHSRCNPTSSPNSAASASRRNRSPVPINTLSEPPRPHANTRANAPPHHSRQRATRVRDDQPCLRRDQQRRRRRAHPHVPAVHHAARRRKQERRSSKHAEQRDTNKSWLHRSGSRRGPWRAISVRPDPTDASPGRFFTHVRESQPRPEQDPRMS